MATQPPASGTEPTPGHGQTLSLPPDPARYQKQLHSLMEIAWAVSSTLHVDTLLPRIMQKVTEIIKADRSTFFVVDRASGELWSKVTQGGAQAEIRMRVGEGIAGAVAQSAETVNLADAYEDPRFNRSFDLQTGYRTRSLLCVPIHDRNLSVIAVIQCLNKQGRRRFDEEDEELLRCISGQCAIALENAFLYEEVLQRNRALEEAEANLRRANTELEVLYDLERQIAEAGEFQTLLHELLGRACSLLKAEAAAILLISEHNARLYSRRASSVEPSTEVVELRRARGLLARAQMPVFRSRDEAGGIADALIAEDAGLAVRETFSAPLSDSRNAIGVIQLANRSDPGATEDWMLRMVSLFGGQIARGIVVQREREAGERAERLALLGHSVSAILHDMRTPMTAAGGYAELMAAEDDPNVRKDYVARIARALQHMETMTQEVLAFARGKREILIQRVALDRFIEEVREMLLAETSHYGMQLAIHADYEGNVRLDESKMKRVLFNLARNACQAMSPGGCFTLNVKREGERLVFECSDNGPGIPSEMEGKLFESFASHGKQNGTGLGLAMAAKIVDAHCGKIDCRSIPGQGATFRIELPL